MKVKELIEILSKVDPEMEVVSREFDPVLGEYDYESIVFCEEFELLFDGRYYYDPSGIRRSIRAKKKCLLLK